MPRLEAFLNTRLFSRASRLHDFLHDSIENISLSSTTSSSYLCMGGVNRGRRQQSCIFKLFHFCSEPSPYHRERQNYQRLGFELVLFYPLVFIPVFQFAFTIFLDIWLTFALFIFSGKVSVIIHSTTCFLHARRRLKIHDPKPTLLLVFQLHIHSDFSRFYKTVTCLTKDEIKSCLFPN